MKALNHFYLVFVLSFAFNLKAQDQPNHLSLLSRDELTLYLVYGNLTSCNGACDGQVSAVVTGGQPPYSYSWSNGSADTIIQNVCPGIGTVTVTDATGNMTSEDYFIEILACPEVKWTNLIITQPSDGQDNGSIALDSTLIDTSLFYVDSFWSIDGIHFTPYYIFPHLGPGIYHLYIPHPFDSTCICPAGEIVLYDITSTEELFPSFDLYPNPVSNLLHLTSDIPLSVELLDVQGRSLELFGASTVHEIPMSDFPDGIYVVKISDGEKVSYKKIVKSRT